MRRNAKNARLRTGVSDFQQAFVQQHEPDIQRPAAMDVREPDREELLRPGTPLKDYFEDEQDDTNNHHPGRSKATALVLTLPFSSTRTEAPRKHMNLITEIAIDNFTQKLTWSLREGRIGNAEIELQGSAQAARLYLRRNPLSLPILPDGETTLRTRLSSESFNLNYLAEQSNIKLVAANSIEDIPIWLWLYISYTEVASWTFRGETEDEIHSYVHTAITGAIRKLFGNTFTCGISRNKALKTSSGRAVYSISSNNLQLFRGEDNMSWRVTNEDAAKELIANTPKGQQWETIYGSSVPYIFGYYSIGGRNNIELQFVAIPQKGDYPVPLTDAPFDLTKFSGILGCRLFCLSLAPHLLAVKKNIKSSFGPDWCIIHPLDGRPLWRSSKIQIGLDSTHGDCCLVKDLYYDVHTKEARRWVEKWKTLSLPNMPHLLSLRRIDLSAGRVRRVFAPFCKPEAMSGEFFHALEAKKCIAHVSKALKALHDVGLVHNDVRWANVVQKVGEQAGYVLVDYDDMERMNGLGVVPAIDWMDGQSHAPDMTSEHNENVDLWGLCKMISELRCFNGDLQDLVPFGRSCLQKYPESVRDYTAFLMELGRHLEGFEWDRKPKRSTLRGFSSRKRKISVTNASATESVANAEEKGTHSSAHAGDDDNPMVTANAASALKSA